MTLMNKRSKETFYLLSDGQRYKDTRVPGWAWIIAGALLGLIGGAVVAIWLRIF